MRRGEVAGVRVDDLDLDQGLLRVMGKGGRERLVPLGRKLVQALGRYLRVRLRHEHEGAAALFLGRAGSITPSGVYQIVRNRARGRDPERVPAPVAPLLRPRLAGGRRAGDGPHARGRLAQSGHGRPLCGQRGDGAGPRGPSAVVAGRPALDARSTTRQLILAGCRGSVGGRVIGGDAQVSGTRGGCPELARMENVCRSGRGLGDSPFAANAVDRLPLGEPGCCSVVEEGVRSWIRR